MQTPNFRATTQSMKEELLLKVKLLSQNSQHYENAMIFSKTPQIFLLNLNGYTED